MNDHDRAFVEWARKASASATMKFEGVHVDKLVRIIEGLAPPKPLTNVSARAKPWSLDYSADHQAFIKGPFTRVLVDCRENYGDPDPTTNKILGALNGATNTPATEPSEWPEDDNRRYFYERYRQYFNPMMPTWEEHIRTERKGDDAP